MSWRPLVGWVVDVQRDFMDPDGRLYVHDLFDPADAGATLARGRIIRTVRWLREHGDAVVFTGDWHALGDREIDPVAPDAAKGTYPPHCMGLSVDEDERRGALLIPEIDPGDDLLVLPRDATAEQARDVARRAVHEKRPVFVQKREFSVFEGNPATDPFLAALADALGAAPRVIVCGVATDVCVRHAVEAFLDRGVDVDVVRDATWGLGLLDDTRTFDTWRSRGARETTIEELSSATSPKDA